MWKMRLPCSWKSALPDGHSSGTVAGSVPVHLAMSRRMLAACARSSGLTSRRMPSSSKNSDWSSCRMHMNRKHKL